jgi:hypothetical protein
MTAAQGTASAPRFAHYIGIDYSGAGQPTDRLTGLRCYTATATTPPVEVVAPGRFPRWSRATLASWLEGWLDEADPSVIAIDHGFSFPLQYFSDLQLPRDWDAFLDDFVAYWPTHQTSVETLREGNPREGQATWRRRTELRARGAKSVFHFDVQGSVAKSTHAGLPWIRRLRRSHPRLHCWPFDGWAPPPGVHVLAEGFPSLLRHRYPVEDRSADQHDAYSLAAWLRQADHDGSLWAAFTPVLGPVDLAAAAVEGWILGVDGAPRQ